MKNTNIFVLIITALIFSACSNDDDSNISEKITYNGANPVVLAYQKSYQLEAHSTLALSYISKNPSIASVSSTGLVKGLNQGETNILIRNEKDSLNVHVKVQLIEEPSFSFGEDKDYIKKLYGEPDFVLDDNIFIYGGGETHDKWYNYPVVWNMSFHFENNKYYASTVNISKIFYTQLDKFLEKYYYWQDVVDGDDTIHYYLNSTSSSAATLIIGRYTDKNIYPPATQPTYDEVLVYRKK